MRRPPTPFLVALVLFTASSAIGLSFAAADDASDKGTVAGAAVLGVVTAVILWSYATRGHRWPKWVLLVLIVFGLGSQVIFLDLRSLFAVIDVAALVVLLRGWSSIDQQSAGGFHRRPAVTRPPTRPQL